MSLIEIYRQIKEKDIMKNSVIIISLTKKYVAERRQKPYTKTLSSSLTTNDNIADRYIGYYSNMEFLPMDCNLSGRVS